MNKSKWKLGQKEMYRARPLLFGL